MNWNVSIQRTAKCGRRQEASVRYRISNKEVRTEPGWPGVWGLVGWICPVSGQGEHLQGHQSLMWHPRHGQLHLGPRKLFQHDRLISLMNINPKLTKTY